MTSCKTDNVILSGHYISMNRLNPGYPNTYLYIHVSSRKHSQYKNSFSGLCYTLFGHEPRFLQIGATITDILSENLLGKDI